MMESDENNEAMDPAKILPFEMMEEIFLYLTSAELVKCALVSKLWRSIAYSDLIWKSKYINDSFPPINNNVITRYSSIVPPHGSWVDEYRYQASPTVPPSEFIHFKKSMTLMTEGSIIITALDTDGKLLAVQYCYRFVEIFNLSYMQCEGGKANLPLQRIEHEVVPHLDNRISICNNDLILFESGKVHFYKKKGCFKLMKMWRVKNWLMEVVTKDYVYLMFTQSFMIWSIKDLTLLKTVEVDSGLKLLKGSESVCVVDNFSVQIWDGLKVTEIDVGMEVLCYGSNKYLRAFHCEDDDEFYYIVVYRPNGEMVYKEIVSTGVTQVDPLLNWGVRFVYWNMRMWCWKTVTFDGGCVVLDSAFLDDAPFPLNHKYIMYQFDMTLCLFDVTKSKIVSEFKMGSHYHYVCANGVIVLRSADNATVYFFPDRYLS